MKESLAFIKERGRKTHPRHSLGSQTTGCVCSRSFSTIVPFPLLQTHVGQGRELKPWEKRGPTVRPPLHRRVCELTLCIYSLFSHLLGLLTPGTAADPGEVFSALGTPYTVPVIAAEHGQRRGDPGTAGQAGGHQLLQPVVSGLAWETNRRISCSQRWAIFLVVRKYLPTRGSI